MTFLFNPVSLKIIHKENHYLTTECMDLVSIKKLKETITNLSSMIGSNEINLIGTLKVSKVETLLGTRMQ